MQTTGLGHCVVGQTADVGSGHCVVGQITGIVVDNIVDDVCVVVEELMLVRGLHETPATSTCITNSRPLS